MDIINHGAWSYYLIDKLDGAVLDFPHIAIVSAVVMGVAPDLAGIVGGSINKKWGVYNEAHRFRAWMLLLPFYALHLLMDYPAHIKERKYWWHCDIASWIILAVLYFFT